MLSVFIYLTDELLSVRLGIDPMLPNKQRQLAERYHRRYMGGIIGYEMLWEGRLNLTELVSKAREQLNGCKRSENQRNGELLAILEQTRKGLDKWRRQQDDTLTSMQDTLSTATINNPRNLDPPSPTCSFNSSIIMLKFIFSHSLPRVLSV